MNGNAYRVLASLFVAGRLAAAVPALTGVVNPASNIPPGLPNYGIAQGSIFVVYGSNLGPASLVAAAALPLPTTAGLAGTSVSVTVNGMTVAAPMIYSFQTQVAAVLPSNTPVGTGTLTVTFNGAGGSIPITVVATNFGISTVNQSGSGQGVVTYPNYALVTGTNSAKPGDVLVVWGTGLGAITGSDAVIPTPSDLGTPIRVYVGGAQASVVYRGRSGSPGLDQINIVVPQGVAAGCNVSLVIQTGNVVSNTVSIPVAPTGGTCSDPGAAGTSGTSAAPANLNNYRYGAIEITSIAETLTLNGQTSTTSLIGAAAGFDQVTVTTPTGGTTSTSGTPGTVIDTTSFGSCSVLTLVTSLTGTGGGGSTGTSGVTVTPLDAGKSLSLVPPNGSPIIMTSLAAGSYEGTLSALPAGTYRFSNGSGGADVGPFTLTETLSPPLVWTNQNIAATTINRSNPFTLTWTGGDPAGYVEISLSTEAVTTSAATEAIITCTAPVSAGQFTVPSYALLSLIPNATVSLVSLGGFSEQTVNIPGLDLAYFYVSETTAVGTASTVFE